MLGEDIPGLVAPRGEIIPPPKPRVSDLWTVKSFKERENLPGEDKLFQVAK